jgi:hypothetical protein
MRVLGAGLLAGWLFLSLGCASSATRLPASFKPKYNSKIVTSLTTAALNRVLFQVDPAVFRDVGSRQIDQCRTRETPTWSQAFLNFLNLVDQNPEFYDKFSIVEFKPGNRAAAEITQDIDGLSRLTISYGKIEKNEKVLASTKMPCVESAQEYLGKDLVTTTIEWPSASEISQVIRAAKPRSDVARFQFNTDFLVFLAERQAVLKINPEVAFERNFDGTYFLTSWLEDMAKQIKDPAVEQDYINYWFREIAIHSSQAKNIQFFGLHPELNSGTNASVGVQVDTAGKLAQKMNSYQEASYLFFSYRQQGSEYIYGGLKDLNLCLRTLTGIYRNPLSMGSSLENEGSSFLAPGHSCPVRTKEAL